MGHPSLTLEERYQFLRDADGETADDHDCARDEPRPV